MLVPVYLSRYNRRDHAGVVLALRERRLVRQNGDDPVIAVVRAPRGSRVRTRPDQHGPDQLIVPVGSSLWSRLFGPRVIIPAKYLIVEARSRSYGLAIAEATLVETVA